MKRIVPLILAIFLLALTAGCGSSAKTGTAGRSADTKARTETAGSTSAKPETSPEQSAGTAAAASEETASSGTQAQTFPPAAHSDVLIAYFSATGTTKGVAEKIASVTGGDLYEILAAEPYSAADLNYNDRNSRSTKEQNDKSARPGIGSGELSLEGYKTVYLGFPIWWGEEPRILDTFVEKYGFEGITVIPFCTSASSGIGRSGRNMESLAGSGTWLEGKRFGGNVSEDELRSWIEGLK